MYVYVQVKFVCMCGHRALEGATCLFRAWWVCGCRVIEGPWSLEGPTRADFCMCKGEMRGSYAYAATARSREPRTGVGAGWASVRLPRA